MQDQSNPTQEDLDTVTNGPVALGRITAERWLAARDTEEEKSDG